MRSVLARLPERSKWLPVTAKSSLPAYVILAVLLATLSPRAETATRSQGTLRSSEPLETVIADLEAFVPAYMAQESLPGVAIALIRDGRTAWVRGFGLANQWTRRPVQDDTIFEVGSNSKVMTAFVALRLVDQGKLELDVPLNRYLAEPWLPPSEYRDIITLRHCLSHSAGFGHNTTSRQVLFPPASRYSYSAIGIAYVQEVVETVSAKPLDRLAEDLLFGPLGMASSSFVNPAPLAARTANGHVWPVVPALIWTVCYLTSLALVGVAGWSILRIVTRRWRPSWRAAAVIAVIALIPPLSALFFLLGGVGLSEFSWLIGLYGTGSMTGFVLAYVAGSRTIAWISTDRSRAGVQARVAWVVLLFVGWVGLSIGLRNLPVPTWPAVPPNGAGSARASAADLSRFLIELAQPTLLTPETAAELRVAQVRLSGDLSWGLGPGILHTEQGDALWQWGQHVDFQSLMVVYPEARLGAVVLTNSDLLNPDVAVTIAHRAIGGKLEPVLRAIHLQFNFRGEG
jgi:CubicO group peptidase (beta-lactamase class C family)